MKDHCTNSKKNKQFFMCNILENILEFTRLVKIIKHPHKDLLLKSLSHFLERSGTFNYQLHTKPIGSQGVLPKMHFLDILEIFSLLAILDPIYPRRYLQHDSIPFFPLARCFMTFCSGMCKNQSDLCL